ncbi:MAG: hypothetical protein NVS2B14_14100 [Chamaesiphon sp.]
MRSVIATHPSESASNNPMTLKGVSRASKGFTLVETIIITVIVGVLAAISAPSFLAMYNRAKVNAAVNTIQGALQEAQRTAIRRSQNCSVVLDTTNNQITSSNGCLITGDRTLPEQVTLSIPQSNTNTTINYGFRGNTNNNNTILIGLADGSGQTKCLVISRPLGMLRAGIYDGNTCNKLQ